MPSLSANSQQPTPQRPRFSVVVPAYNAEPYLQDCMQSVLNQTDPDFELIIVDDGSTDGTAERVRSLSWDARVKLVQRCNGGLAAARNTGIQAAQGEWVAFLDADDRWCPEKLATHRHYLATQPEIAVTYDRAVFMDQAGQRTGLRLAKTDRPLTAERLLLKNYLGNGSTPIVRRSVLQAAGVFNENLKRMVDHELWVRLSWRGYSFLRVPGVLTEYRLHPQSLSANSERMLQGLQVFLEEISLYAPDLVQRLRPLILACNHRWMARSAFAAGDYSRARHHALHSLQSAPSVIWRDPRAPITFLAILLQSITPSFLFTRLQSWGLQLAHHWFSVQADREQQANPPFPFSTLF